jgi:hypothetical protein
MSWGQKKKRNSSKDVFVGMQVKPIIPINYFNAGPIDLSDTLTDLTIGSKLGYNIGMVLRKDFTNLLSFETGISYTRRNYAIKTYESKRDTTDYSDFGMIAYQIPLQALVYIRLSEKWYMNTSGGIGIDMYASHVQSIGDNSLIQHLSLRRYWMHFSLLANVGFEYRTEKSGRFYLGASLVNPFQPITNTKMDYYYGNTARKRYETQLTGIYLTLDLRYFFPNNTKKQYVKTERDHNA